MGGSQTASLTSSVLNYKFENGRRYHSYREGTYILPNDEPEQDRLDVLHHIFRIAIDGALYCAPLEENFQPNRVLDLGTGTGIWAIDFADKFPGSVVIGIDLSPIQPIWVPPNCKFYVDDMESDWGYPLEEHFEYIHGRGLAGSIADWKELFHQAYANLKAGGWFEMQEFQNKVYSDDDTIQLVKGLIEWDDELEEASIKFGKPLRIAHLLKDWMEEAGFVEVREKIVKASITYLRKAEKGLTNPYRSLLVLGLKTRSINCLEDSVWQIFWKWLILWPTHCLRECLDILQMRLLPWLPLLRTTYEIRLRTYGCLSILSGEGSRACLADLGSVSWI